MSYKELFGMDRDDVLYWENLVFKEIDYGCDDLVE